MRAVAIDGFGGREVMCLADLPAPRPQPGEVGVRMAFASVNPADWKLREGWLNTFPSFRPSFPFVLGYDGAGIVESVGDGVTGLKPGDRVAAKADQSNARWGSFAEMMCVRADLAGRLPDHVSLADAATLPVAGVTAWHGLFLHGGLKARQSVFVNAGAGAVGTLAVQFARLADARVAASCSDANAARLHQLGAETIVDYADPARIETVGRSFPDGLDLVLDAASAANSGLLTLLRPGGVYVRIPSLGPGDMVTVPGELQGRGLRIVTGGIVPAQARDAIERIGVLLGSGKLALPPTRLRPLDEAAEALEDNRTGAWRGKQVLQIVAEPA